MKSHFHITGFTASLALKQKFGATRKWSIFQNFSGGATAQNPPDPAPPPPAKRVTPSATQKTAMQSKNPTPGKQITLKAM